MIPPEILAACEMRCDVAGIWALAIAADPTGRQARREILTAALEEAAPAFRAAAVAGGVGPYPVDQGGMDIEVAAYRAAQALGLPPLASSLRALKDLYRAGVGAGFDIARRAGEPEPEAVTAIRAAERARIWAQPVTQRLEFHSLSPAGMWCCAGCLAQMTEGVITHEPRCSEIRLAALIGETP
jgi:hypothetical protein